MDWLLEEAEVVGRDEADVGDATPRFRELALAAVVASVMNGDHEAVAPEISLLRERLPELMSPGEIWLPVFEAALRQPATADRPLLELARALALTPFELLTVALAAAVEDDALAGRALARVQAPVGGARPTLGLLAAALAAALPEGGSAAAALLNGAAVRTGLITLLNEAAPLPERAVAVPTPLCLALMGADAGWPGATLGLEAARAVSLPPGVVQEAARQAAALRAAPEVGLVIRSGSVSEARSVAGEVATALGARPLFIETDKLTGLGPWLVLRRLLPVFCLELTPGERRVLPELPGYDGPFLTLCGPDGSVETAHGAPANWTLSVPARAEREALWQRAMGDEALARELGTHHRHGTGRIAHLGRLARHQAGLNGRIQPTPEDVTRAAWSGEGGGLDALAEPLRAEVPSEALVLTSGLEAELRLLLLRCRSRDELVEGLGASATTRYRPGVRALFAGPSGTGKTLAAGWLATQLGLPLYRVDLAAVTSKYIGETEKNLAQLLARAEQAEVILLFDEADSLFGKRTDIKEANDRFANAQTNYLLQRIENFDGLVLLTSNSRARFDAAFARRLDFVIEFPLPGPEERRQLWRSHLGAGHSLALAQLNLLASAADLGGGHIRNAVLTAAVLARDARRLIGYGDLLAGAAIEYRKLGRQLPGELQAGSTNP